MVQLKLVLCYQLVFGPLRRAVFHCYEIPFADLVLIVVSILSQELEAAVREQDHI